MAVAHATIALTQSAALISGVDEDGVAGSSVAFTNETGVDVRVGGTGVTTGTGKLVASGAEFSMDLEPGERLYAVCASGNHNLFVMYGGA